MLAIRWQLFFACCILSSSIQASNAIASSSTIGIVLPPSECVHHCLNDASCRAANGTILKCICPNGFEGSRCEIRSGKCPTDYCVNGGTCHVIGQDSYGEVIFGCHCLDNFSGDYCEIESKCETACISDSVCRAGSCVCRPGSEGTPGNCVPKDCNLNPCLNNGTCVANNDDRTATCNCQLGYSGLLCQLDFVTVDCPPNTCPDGHLCEKFQDEIRCICPKGFAGISCNVPLGSDCSIDLCMNGGTCVKGNPVSSCRCPAQFDGPFCQFDVNECLTIRPCGRGNCTNTHGSYTCNCEPGWTGHNCLEKIRHHCQNGTCQNDGLCVEQEDGFRCVCSDRYAGKFCEIESTAFGKKSTSSPLADDPESSSCGSSGKCFNGGICKVEPDKGGSRCACPKGYGGKWCEIELSCNHIPCLNNGTCIKMPGNAVGVGCKCLPDYYGSFCEFFAPKLAIRFKPTSNFCFYNPCQNDGLCDESTQSCVCGPGFQGVLCEQDLDECDHRDAYCPLQFSVDCVNQHGDYQCECKPGYAAKNCSIRLNACDDHRCADRQICTVTWDSGAEKQQAQCECAPGYTFMPSCLQSTVASFSGQSMMVDITSNNHTATATYQLELQFRTTLENGFLIFGDDLFNSNIFQVLLLDGQIQALWSGKRVRIEQKVNDGTWNRLSLSWHADTMLLRLQRSKAGDVHLKRLSSGGALLASAVASTKFGGTPLEKQHPYYPDVGNFVGCMRDVIVNGKLLIPEKMGASAVNVGWTCPRRQDRELCDETACPARSHCVDVWNQGRCVCDRPYLMPNCENSLPEVTFGFGRNISFVMVDIARAYSIALHDRLDLSMLIRSTALNGVICYIGTAIDEQQHFRFNEHHAGCCFIGLELRDGYPVLVSSWNSTSPTVVSSENRLNDGRVHLIEIKYRPYVLKVLVDSQPAFINWFDDNGQTTANPLSPEQLIIGTHPILVTNRTIVDHSIAVESFSTFTSFKGTIQDVRINDDIVELAPVADDVVSSSMLGKVNGRITRHSLLLGTQSDDLCASKPCANGAQCTVTFNDYECQCEPAWVGKNCSIPHPCLSEPCPVDWQCRLKPHTYEHVCLNSITFSEQSRALFQVSNGPNAADHVAFSIRTRTKHGSVMSIRSTARLNEMQVFLKDGRVLVSRLVAGEKPILLDSLRPIADAQWHHVHVGLWPNLTMELDQNVMMIAGPAIPLPSETVWHFGSYTDQDHIPTERSPEQMRTDESFVGCLRAVSFGSDAYVPFFDDHDDRGSSLGQGVFRKISFDHLTQGCQSNVQCGLTDICENGATCSDEWNLVTCTCLPGFSGLKCENDVDECEYGWCKHGSTCRNLIGDFACDCLPGWTDVDDCAFHPCMNGGTCVDGENEFHCLCTANFTGPTCENRHYFNCSSGPCENGAQCEDAYSLVRNAKPYVCHCGAGYTGERCELEIDYCATVNCLNNGTCKTSIDHDTYICNCQNGYTGKHCEHEIDECASSPCQNGGTCSDLMNNFTCTCALGWIGARCEIDVDECSNDHGSNLCQNGAQCINMPGSFYCQCPPYVSGLLCEIAGTCVSSPCKHGNCTQLGPDRHVCRCYDGYSGDQCEEMIDFCDSNPCHNEGGVCHSFVGGYNCTCFPGFRGICIRVLCYSLLLLFFFVHLPFPLGEQCEENIDDCINRPCKNNGKCYDQINGFSCDCTGTGYEGIFCELDINECETPDFCNGGNCTNLPGSFKCSCLKGDSGDRCENLNPCDSNDTHYCQNGGICKEPYVDYQRGIVLHRCDCVGPYTGQFCEIKIHEAKSEVEAIPSQTDGWVEFVVGPVVGFILILVLLGFTLLVIVAKKKNATRGTYSPSRQESDNARLTLHPVIFIYQIQMNKIKRMIDGCGNIGNIEPTASHALFDLSTCKICSN
ncbi:Uncharacterized protein T4C_13788 [Trichinella pseudospiralis]|uniref:Uncharacterized protein n=1 Tax=Trichinella pseudospiralis TaxID=6337 RepID=A0A0V1JU19_TRIPS|nr:Uncharacterized protein T4C_13788 [Trichinella pseudospiralis]